MSNNNSRTQNNDGQSKPLKIIRVERTTPATTNDTLKNNRIL